MDEHLFDVIEVQIKAPHTIRMIEENKTKRNAEAIVEMAVIRRGVEYSFFTTTPAGRHKDGDQMPQESQ